MKTQTPMEAALAAASAALPESPDSGAALVTIHTALVRAGDLYMASAQTSSELFGLVQKCQALATQAKIAYRAACEADRANAELREGIASLQETALFAGFQMPDPDNDNDNDNDNHQEENDDADPDCQGR